MNAAWSRVKLGELVSPTVRAEAVEADKEYRLLGVRLDGRGPFLRETLNGAASSATRLFKVHSGDFIYSRLFAGRGAFGIIGAELDGCFVSGEFPTFTPSPEKLDARFLSYWFRLSRTLAMVDENCSGSTPLTRNRFKENFFLALEIPLPPLAEQQRIVARIEALAEQIREAQRLRQQASEEAETLHYSVMKKMRLELSNSAYPKATLGSLTRVSSGGTPSRDNPAYWGGSIPWIKTGELLDRDIIGSEEQITELGVANSSAKVFPPDTILIALYGQGQTRGRTGRLMLPATTNQACCAVLPNLDVFEPRFIQLWLRSLYHDLREEAQGGAQPNWNGSMIKNLEIAVPPIAEQRRIVAELNGLQAQVDALKRTQAETAAELDALLPAILAKAFRGEL